jgi:TonB family protein
MAIPFARSQLRYLLATIAMLANLVLPLITFWLIFEQEYTVFVNQLASLEMLQNGLLSNDNIVLTRYQEVLGIFPVISLLWLVAVCFLACKLFIELYNVNRLTSNDVVLPNQVLAQRFSFLVNKIELKKAPNLLISLKIDVPMAIGWLKPVVLIPATMLTGLTPAQLDMLILHELAHIRRHDYLVNFLQTLVETLLFFHPAGAWVSKQMRNEREYCSDDIAVEISGNPVAYAHTLADTASLCQQKRHHTISSMAIAASGGDLKQRVLRLVGHTPHFSLNDSAGKWLASFVLLLSILVISLKQHISAPIQDFTSAQISMFHSASQYIKNQPSNLSSPSVISNGQQIPTPTPAKNLSALLTNSLPILKDKAFNSEHGDSHATNIDSVAKDKAAITSFTKPRIATDTSANVNRLSVLSDDKVSVTKVFTEPKTLVLDTTQKSSSLLVIESQQPSISARAFIQTDSKNLQSALANPYLNEVIELASEPTFNSEFASVDSSAISELASVTAFENAIKVAETLSDEKIAKKTPVRVAAKIISSAGPRYPSMAKRKGLELDVLVDFTIDTNGRVKNIHFTKGSKVNYFKSAVRNAMAKWRFLPAQLNGEPVESQMSKIFSFSLLK